MENTREDRSISSDFLKTGRIVAVDPATHTYTIQVEGAGFISGKTCMTSSGGFFRGPGDSTLFEEGTTVLYYHAAGTGYILGVLPQPGVPSTHVAPLCFSSVDSVSESPKDKGFVTYRGASPPDAIPGDFIKYNPEGGFLALLRGPIAKMGTSPVNQVLFNGIDSLARLVSRNLDIFTDLGELKVSNDEGETNFELFASPTFQESIGADRPGEELGVHSPDGERNRYRTEPYDRVGKWRIHAFAGWLGDAIHLFISRKGDSNQRTAGETVSGVTEIVLSNDGAVRVRSCRELMLEKVSRIRVPKKVREAYHNEHGDSKDKDYVPSPHVPFDWDNEHPEGRRAQIPEYHSHVVDHEEIRRFKDHNKDWNVTSERNSDIPKQAQDLWEGQEEAEFEETYSLIHQRSDGSVYIEDTDGSCIDMVGGSVSISSKKDIRLQAGRDILMTAGRDITSRAQKEVEIVSHSSNIRIKSTGDLLLASERNASLDSAEGNTSILSRKGSVLLRSERKDITLKADLQEVNVVSVNSGVHIRGSQYVDLLSDVGDIKLHGSSLVQLTSSGRILSAVGTEAPTASMSASERNTNGKTNVTLAIDSGNSAGVSDLRSYVDLTGGDTKVFGENLTEVESSTKASVFTSKSHLTLDSNYELSSLGNGTLRKRGALEILDQDSDGDSIWQEGSLHTPRTTVGRSAEELVSVKADIHSTELANARFRYRSTKNQDTPIYPYPWQKMDLKNPPSDTTPWKDVIDVTVQDTPDIDFARPVVGDSQSLQTDTGEQLPPFSNYYTFNGGSYSFEDGVIPGSFSETEDFYIYKPATTTTDDGSIGRINHIPDSAKGESFEGTKSKAVTEDVVNEEV